jgi:hypothetical protein
MDDSEGITQYADLPLPLAIQKAKEKHNKRMRQRAMSFEINDMEYKPDNPKEYEIREFKRFSQEIIKKVPAKNNNDEVQISVSENPNLKHRKAKTEPKKTEIRKTISLTERAPDIEMTNVGCGVMSHKLTDNEIIKQNYVKKDGCENLSVINFRLLYWFLLISGCYAPHSSSCWLKYVYPLLITFNLLYSIIYHFEYIELSVFPSYLNVGLIFLTGSIFILWLGRKHLMNSWFNCNPEVNHIITQYELYFHKKKNRAEQVNKEINTILSLSFIIWMAFFGYQSYDYSKVPSLETSNDMTMFVFFRIGWFYYYLIMTSFFTYCYFVFVIHNLELKSIHNRIKTAEYGDFIEMIHHHRIINRRMQKTSQQIGILLFIGISMILIRIPISFYLYNKNKESAQLIFIAICLIIFLIYISKIASINDKSDKIIARMYDYQTFKDIEMEQVERYVKKNPAYFKILGIAITYSMIVAIFFPLINVVIPVLFTWLGFNDDEK